MKSRSKTVTTITEKTNKHNNLSIGLIKLIVESLDEYKFIEKKRDNRLIFIKDKDYYKDQSELVIHTPITLQRLMLKITDDKFTKGFNNGIEKNRVDVKNALGIATENVN